MSESLPVVPSTRQGRYDVDVEIFRRGDVLTGYLSHVRPGDCFRKIENGKASDRWFSCFSPITKSILPRDPDNPTFSMYGCEVMQAAPTIERPRAALPGPAPEPEAPDDVEDVDFQEKE